MFCVATMQQNNFVPGMLSDGRRWMSRSATTISAASARSSY